MKYTKKEFLRAAEIGEVSMIDARHIVSLLGEAKKELDCGYSCRLCDHLFMNPFDEYFCEKKYDLEEGDCKGIDFKTK